MTLPDHVLKKRRLQIMDDETRDGDRLDARTHEKTGHQDPREDIWVNNFVTRFTALVRSIGSKPRDN
jgi:hypothetical protein